MLRCTRNEWWGAKTACCADEQCAATGRLKIAETVRSTIGTAGSQTSWLIDPERSDTSGRGDENASSSSAASKPADSLQLTDTATRLAELQAEVAAADGVDIERVEAIRQQIADGSYKVDADRIADARMTMEQELL